MAKRIWELDALRGICVLGMVAVHLSYDLVSMGAARQSTALSLALEWGGTLFVLLSGICVTLGRRHIRRGLTVLGCGMLCTAVTAGMFALGMASRGIIIYFGILHCLGVCMLLWCVFSRWPGWALGVCGAALILVGLYLDSAVSVSFPWLIPLGVKPVGFVTADYFPLLPYLGFFLTGALLGRRLYAKKETLFPKVNPGTWPVRFLSFCGRHSLLIYLLHQPVLTALLWLV